MERVLSKKVKVGGSGYIELWDAVVYRTELILMASCRDSFLGGIKAA
jgi:hypothetical protein